MLWFLATAAHAASLTDLSTGDLVVTEVHSSPAATILSRGQWFEVYNAYGDTVDLDGLVISDGGGQSFTVSGTLELAAGEYAVFATRAAPIINGGLPTVDYVYSTTSYSLAAGNEALELSFSGTTFDSVSFGGASFPDPFGASVTLDPTVLDTTSNDDGQNWCPAVSTYGDGDYGTPGAANDACPIGIDSLISGDLVITEVMFAPAASAYNKGEWFELYNASGVYVDIDGLNVDSGTGESMTVAGELLMRPGERVLFAARTNPAVNGGLPTVDYRYVYGIDLILTASDTLEISDGVTIFDDVSWNPTDYPGGAGIALQLNSTLRTATDNDISSSWCDATIAYGDGDYGTPGTENTDCDPDSDGDGYDEDVDCDDEDASVNPGATEVCDGIDNDCDALVDNDPSDGSTYYADTDDDKYGNPLDSINACSRPNGYRTNALDCNDTDAAVNPGEPELCDGTDNNCSGDEDDASDAPAWYPDNDSDTYGSDADVTYACSQPSGYLASGGDCDDTNGAINPAAEETCDGTDNNCSGDEDDASDALTFYADVDNDKFGDPLSTANSCARPSGYRTNNFDCDDTNASINPGEPEVCDGTDNNCSGDEDDASDASAWYPDNDSDTYGSDADITYACSQPSGYLASGGDCDDTNGAVNPAAEETCDGTDNNCSGDENDASDALTFYADVDNDKYGDPLNTANACSRPSGYRTNALDCDDTDASINPGEEDICNDGIDQDCDNKDYATCDATLAAADAQLSGGSAGDQLGVAGAIGDVDGDGTLDFALVSGAANSVYVFDGGADWTGDRSVSEATYTLTGAADAGNDVILSGTTDVDGDGFDDVLVSSITISTNGSNAGGGYVVYGPLSGDVDLTAESDVTLLGDNADDNAGRTMFAVGDVNDDGYDDIFMTAQGEDTIGDGSGAAYLVLGPTTGGNLSTTADAIYTGSAARDYLGWAAAPVGDVDGDGSPDVMVNAYRADRTVSEVTSLNVGASYLLTSFSTGTQDISTAAAATVYGETEKDQTGAYIAGAGDLDGDGYADILLGSQYVDPDGRTDAGEAYLLLGPLSGELSVTDAAARFPGVAAGDNAGRSAEGLGDINGDGQGDIVIGAKLADEGATDAGAAYVFLGPVSGTVSLSLADTIFSGEASGDRAGISIAQVGDLDNNGRNDFLIGATMNNDSAIQAGAAYIIFAERW